MVDSLAPTLGVALSGISQVGDVIADKYRVESVLGVGGMGVVLEARHLQLGQIVAIKVLTVSEDQQKDATERFLREGRTAAGLLSDHIVRIYDVGQLADGTPFIVMERLRGRDLARILSEGGVPLPVEEAVEYIAQATMAIAEAHDAGVVHRDLKPANLFLTRRSDGSACIKVLDFGISKQLSIFEAQTLRGDLTQTRQVMGSPAYMSPEQVRDARHVDCRTDIWALGTTLYELLTRHVAFKADTLPAVCAAIAADPPTSIEAFRSDVPAAVIDIVMQCLEKSPEKRFQTARALLSALRVQQGRLETTIVSSQDVGVPPTAVSIDVDGVSTQASEVDTSDSVTGSGPRRVEPPPVLDGKDRTFISGPVALEDASVQGEETPATVASRYHRRKRIGFLIFAGLGLCGVVMAVIALRGSSSSLVVPVPMAGSFNLRIESHPMGATVFEGERWLGETPLVLPIRRATVISNVRQFTLRKSGYLDASFEQGDATNDLRRQVTLRANTVVEEQAVVRESGDPGATRVNRQNAGPIPDAKRDVEPKSGKRPHRGGGVSPSGTASTKSSIPDIRIER
jgi:serine/threonine-protein kinase